MRILFAGGGTGGHVTPVIAIIRELKTIAEKEQILDLEIFFAGPDDQFGKDLLKDENVIFIPIISGKVRNYLSWLNVVDFFKVPVGILQALWNLLFIMPDVIFSKGGFGALPIVVAGIVYRIPIIIHESDSIPGKVNKFTARFAKRIGIAFPAAAEFLPKEKTALVGVPIRKRIFGGDVKEAKSGLEIYSSLPVVGIMGSSQGSQTINEAILGGLKELTDQYEVVHQTGAKNYDAVKEEAAVILEGGHSERYHVFGFLDEGRVRNFFSVSDVVVSRASSTTIFEIAAWGKPSILIPLHNAAQDHQRKNAYQYASGGAAVVIEEGNLTPHILLAEIRKLVNNSEERKKMSEAAQRFARIDSAELIAREILKLGIHS